MMIAKNKTRTILILMYCIDSQENNYLIIIRYEVRQQKVHIVIKKLIKPKNI